jgi:hypothetical protein
MSQIKDRRAVSIQYSSEGERIFKENLREFRPDASVEEDEKQVAKLFAAMASHMIARAGGTAHLQDNQGNLLMSVTIGPPLQSQH